MLSRLPAARTRWLLLACTLALGAGCGDDSVSFPTFAHDAGSASGKDGGTTRVDGQVGTDGSTPADGVVPGPDGAIPDVPGADVVVDPDAGPQPDVTKPDVPGGTDTVVGPDVPAPDTEKPILRSAFSNTQGIVTARFSEPVLAGAAEVGNFTIKASNNQELAVFSATPKPGARQYVDLAVDAGAINSQLTYELTVKNVADEAGNVIAVGSNKARITRTLFLNIVWHQHQPLYLDPVADQLTGPWVRKHATKDYYDMTAIVQGYPNVHFNVNLTSVLLRQLIEYYVDRMDPFIDVHASTMDVPGFLAAWKGRTDPFVDFILQPTPTADTISEDGLLIVWKGAWTLVSTADASMQHFPEYVALRDKNRAEYSQADFLALKIWFQIAWFDPDFLQGPVVMPDGSVTRVHEWLNRSGGKYTLKVPPSEELARDLLIEGHKIVRNVVALHRNLFYDVDAGTGQVEVTTTPMYHPILPLIFDTDLMAQSQPFDPKPVPRFSYPEDARAQVLRSVQFYEETFGAKPRGIWCGEGSVAEAIVPILVDAGFEWTATDHDVLKRTQGDEGAAEYKAYQIDSDTSPGAAGDPNDAMLIVFRHTDLSDRMGFLYKTWKGVDAAANFMDDVTALAPSLGGEDRLVTVILDGENAWETYTQEHDGKGFLHALYQRLSESFETGEVATVTTSEYIHGNPARAIEPHPIASHTELEPLWAGSWIGATFSTWIGEQEENKAWEYLRQAREDLASSGLPEPNHLAPKPPATTELAYEVWKAFDSMYAAEGSDWFWWYGVDQITPSNDDSPFDRAFRSQLLGMYTHMNNARGLLGLAPIPVPDFAPLIQAKPEPVQGPYGPEAPAPTIDGLFVPNEEEWSPPGGFFFDSDSSTAISSNDDISTIYYGYDDTAFYVAIQAAENLYAKRNSDYSIALLVDHKHVIDPETGQFTKDPANDFTPPGEAFVGLEVARRVRADFSGAAVVLRLEEADGSGGWSEVAVHSGTLGGPGIGGGMVLEMRVPFGDLNLAGPTDPLNFYVVAIEGGEVIDAAPSLNAKRVFDDVTNQVFVTLEVNATGAQIPLGTLGLKELPAPAGNGTVFVVGNHDKIGNWIPNKVGLSDTGKSGDVTPNDGVWTLTLGFQRGDVVQYKYTVGTGTDEGQWPGTEEFPFTNRQYVVPVDPSIVAVKLSDVLGDDPPQENSLGKFTVVTETTE